MNEGRGVLVAGGTGALGMAVVKELLDTGYSVTAPWVVERENPDDPGSRITQQEGKLAVCSDFEEDAFNDFLDDYRGKGPEGFTLDQMAPGSG